MRKFVAPFVLVLGIVGCTASAQIGEPPKPPPPPPPPPAAKPPPPPAKPPQTFQMDGPALKVPGPVVFKTGSAEIDPVSDPVLQVVVDYLNAKPEVTLMRIEGHTDNVGQAPANQTLSEQRAMSVARWIVGKGIDCKRVIPVGFGQTKPIAGTIDKQTKDEQALNRRTSFINAGLKGKPIGGQPVDGGGHVAGDVCH